MSEEKFNYLVEVAKTVPSLLMMKDIAVKIDGLLWADAELSRLREENKKWKELAERNAWKLDLATGRGTKSENENDRLRAVLSQAQKELAEKEARLRDWERSSAESGTVLIRSERYNELLAIEAKVDDVEGMAKMLRGKIAGAYGYNTPQASYESVARALRDYLKGGKG